VFRVAEFLAAAPARANPEVNSNLGDPSVVFRGRALRRIRIGAARIGDKGSGEGWGEIEPDGFFGEGRCFGGREVVVCPD